MVPRPILLARAAYVSAVSAAAGFVSKPLRPLGYGDVQACEKSADPQSLARRPANQTNKL